MQESGPKKFNSPRWRVLRQGKRCPGHRAIPRAMRAYRRDFLRNVLAPRLHSPLDSHGHVLVLWERARALRTNPRLSSWTKNQRFQPIVDAYIRLVGAR
jgi:hypothetical protein